MSERIETGQFRSGSEFHGKILFWALPLSSRHTGQPVLPDRLFRNGQIMAKTAKTWKLVSHEFLDGMLFWWELWMWDQNGTWWNGQIKSKRAIMDIKLHAFLMVPNRFYFVIADCAEGSCCQFDTNCKDFLAKTVSFQYKKGVWETAIFPINPDDLFKEFSTTTGWKQYKQYVCDHKAHTGHDLSVLQTISWLFALKPIFVIHPNKEHY